MIIWEVYIYKETCHETTTHNNKCNVAQRLRYLLVIIETVYKY